MDDARKTILEIPGLRIAFAREEPHPDRLGHRISLPDGGEGAASLLLSSLEGVDADPWPPSPAFQELHAQPGGGGRELGLLVGHSGTCHFSGSVELDAERRRATFDVACRLRVPPERLGSRYALGPEAALRRLGDDAVRIERGRAACELRVQNVEGLAIACRVEGNELWIVPEVPPGSFPKTARWIYTLAAV
jgi:hypothetical protein